MNPYAVNPAAWSNHEVIYNDPIEEFSAVWGMFRGRYCLGTRWNGDHVGRGYPGQGKYPLWYVEPDFLTLSILQRLLINATDRGLRSPSRELYSDKIAHALEKYLEIKNHD